MKRLSTSRIRRKPTSEVILAPWKSILMARVKSGRIPSFWLSPLPSSLDPPNDDYYSLYQIVRHITNNYCGIIQGEETFATGSQTIIFSTQNQQCPVWFLQSSWSWAFGPPAKHVKVSGAGLRARQAVRTGGKACDTGRTFPDSSSWVFGPPINYAKCRRAGVQPAVGSQVHRWHRLSSLRATPARCRCHQELFGTRCLLNVIQQFINSLTHFLPRRLLPPHPDPLPHWGRGSGGWNNRMQFPNRTGLTQNLKSLK